jgi:hypothetical protein
MDELQLIRDFRASVPPAAEATRRQARDLLAERVEGRKSAFGLPGLLGRRQVLVWVVLALLAALLAGSALAFGGRLLDYFRGQPAPPPVRREFANLDPHSVIPYFDFPTVMKGRIHGVLAFDTAAGRVALWAGPTRSGGACYVFRKLRPKTISDRLPLAAGCMGSRVPQGLALVAALQAQSFPGKLAFAWGYTAKNVRTVEVHLADGEVKRTPVYERFFAVGAPATTSLVYAIASDKGGHKLGRCCPLPPIPAPSPPPPARTGSYHTVFDVIKVAHRFTFAVAPARRGGLCEDLSSPGRPHERSCLARPSRLQPLGFGEGGPPGPTWAFFVGRAGKGVASVELRYEDGTVDRLQLKQRFFLDVVVGLHTRRGHRPLVFIARDATGRILATRRLDRRPVPG